MIWKVFTGRLTEGFTYIEAESFDEAIAIGRALYGGHVCSAQPAPDTKEGDQNENH